MLLLQSALLLTQTGTLYSDPAIANYSYVWAEVSISTYALIFL